jgi:hypothetical protein
MIVFILYIVIPVALTFLLLYLYKKYLGKSEDVDEDDEGDDFL